MTKLHKNEFKAISKRVQMLLNREEGSDVEFKQEADALESEDLVAFANSEKGGTILLGVEEIDTPKGLQRGRVVGCEIGDKEKMKIVNKAQSCIPPVDITITLENYRDKPFYRVEIPGGNKKPYCTYKGVYKIRGDGRNVPLVPGNLLHMYLEIEGQRFIERFNEATRELEQRLDKIFTITDGFEDGLLKKLANKIDHIEKYIFSKTDKTKKL